MNVKIGRRINKTPAGKRGETNEGFFFILFFFSVDHIFILISHRYMLSKNNTMAENTIFRVKRTILEFQYRVFYPHLDTAPCVKNIQNSSGLNKSLICIMKKYYLISSG
ncbi:MAG: hypothetical protein A2277_12135 [Desulfobacterales bacterium RIFOXYA12_FULL_46_15]|nr:MAG: hypothetical protein A2097_03515 [Desulfobacula sp. GWF2_41_7]OGR25653.1 MAG: hypothetical protein A2277_12135 [Desulfobacterales bacterium RIFOXYA12_FULL_46_15]